ncbi:ribbon-helix-helix domain-containing protein [Bradyrhizobium roseum]|uniref:ribbon-helix-helix domain-containing protein n=1 Tax=Bradyrhizobium roseum TaxID=3056648 RepID=UPI002601614C|nr:CopG family transcriptional regulator [Bradyrhizobium roseus]WKA26479.1 CopG family transcriptional regulator [Bradyrhizobium roseus]
MKPRVGVYLSKRTAARLTMAAKRREITKSALVEAAIDRFLASDGTSDAVVLTGQLADLSGQVDQLDRNLGIVSEIVSLHARFHLAVVPELPAATQPAPCRVGSARFDEFAAQVERRVQLGAPLMRETMNRLDTTAAAVTATGDRDSVGGVPAACGTGLAASTWVHDAQNAAAVQEDGSTDNFPVRPRRPVH